MHPLCCRAYVLMFVANAWCCNVASCARTTTPNRFHAIALKVNTDKVTEHHYEDLYDKYLQPLADERLRLLEGERLFVACLLKGMQRRHHHDSLSYIRAVGLGCGMPYGPGHSLQLWTEFLPNSEISFVEFDAACAELHRGTIQQKGRGSLYVGDQANVTFLNSIIHDQAGKQFDVIVDDGGHSMEQQKTTLTHLWQLVAPGGIYVMEDLLTSYYPQFGGGPKGHPGTTIEMHKNILDELHCRFQTDCTPTLTNLLDMDCFLEACVMVKHTQPNP